MLEINGNSYELKLNVRTIKQIEAVLGKGVMVALSESGGMMSVTDLTTIAGYGLYNADGNRVSPAQGTELAEQYMTEKGYAVLINIVGDVIKRDCPFFFQVG